MLRVLLFVAIFIPAIASQDQRLPLKDGSTRFAVIGDSGTGDSHQVDVAKTLTAWRMKFPYEFVLMMGDNLYGGDRPQDYQKKFEIPYKQLLGEGVKFYAALGNHDNPNQRLYKPFNMNGERYYSFKPQRGSVRFFALDSNYVDDKQLAWLDKELAASGSDWKICFFHHPLYSSGETHGSADLQRDKLEPMFVKHGVNVVLTGHEHFYERIKPQKGIAYFILGSSAKLRRGDIQKTDLTAKGWDQGYAFMLMDVAADELSFQVISDKGETIDSGSIHRVKKAEPSPNRSTQPVEPGKAPPKPGR
jgi:predicted phosphodiesterase